MFQGLRQVFLFTLRQQLHSKKYVAGTLLTALILFLLPASIMPLVEKNTAAPTGIDSPSPDDLEEEIRPETLTEAVSVVYYAVEKDLVLSGQDQPLDFAFLAKEPLRSFSEAPGFSDAVFTPCSTLEEAADNAAGDPSSLVLLIENMEPSILFRVLLPSGSKLTLDYADHLGAMLHAQGGSLVLRAEGKSVLEAQMILLQAAAAENAAASVPASDSMDMIREILTFVLMYVNVMLVYFLVLFYGQSVSNNVIIEKTSKLMDLFLISVKPRAMIFGKLLAIGLSAIGQFSLWLLSLAGGFWVGTRLVYAINPNSQMLLLQIFQILGMTSGFFSVQTLLMILLMIGAGFFLYCALASIGGALAGKPEDLSTTNILFTLILVVSFMSVLFSGISGLDSGTVTPFGWQDLVPFTSILVTPSRLLLGQVTLVQGLISLAIVLVSSLLIIVLAGKLYQLMAFYKGNPPKPSQILSLLKNNKKNG